MKVLWLTETPSKYKPEEFGYNGRGWIASLQTLLENSPEITQLGIVFPYFKDNQILKDHKTIYYPIKRTLPNNILSWIISNWKNEIEKQEEINNLKRIVDDFEPDVIHIFGTEGWLCHIIKLTNKPCVVHLQGLLQPCLNAYNPVDISAHDLMKYNWVEFIKGISLWHNKRVFNKKSKREYQFFKEISYFMGRTSWDKSISGFLSPGSTYFHVDEVLRDQFYTASPWKYKNRNKVVLTSTLSDALYKGLDLVIKTANLLVREKAEFEWRIIGINNDSKSSKLLKKIFQVEYSSLNIKLLGIKDVDEIISLLTESTLYIHTSYIDNSPNSLCEAQYLGLPIIATNVGGITSLVKDKENGILVPANDPYYLASQIVKLNNDSSELINISKNARMTAEKRHFKESILNQLLNSYKYLSYNKNISKKNQTERFSLIT